MRGFDRGWIVLLVGCALLVPQAGAEEVGVPLIDAGSFAAWTVEGKSKASFRLDGDTVIGQPVGHSPENSFLCSPKTYSDFELRFAFRIAPRSLNSGVQLRSHVREDDIVAGPQLEMAVAAPSELGFARRWLFPLLVRLSDNPWRPRYWPSGGIYGESLEMGWIFPGAAGGDADAFAEQGERLTRQDDWNTLRVVARGKQIQTWFNGEARADFEYAALPDTGRICLQVHGGEYEDPSLHRVEWRDLRIIED